MEKEALILKACRYIDEQATLPTLEEVAAEIGWSANHFQQVFKDALGISPRSYADFNRQQHFRDQLRNGSDISSAIYEAGYGSTSRVYEFAKKYFGMTPKDYQKGGAEYDIWFNIVECSLGYMLIATTEKGICSVKIDDEPEDLFTELQREFHAANLIHGGEHFEEWTQALINYLDGNEQWPLLPYDVKATAFQRKVWEWLRTIPPGETYSYGEVAEAIGQPTAARAVARACATNSVALVIPCHRIVPKSGGVGGYRWGPKRKEKILAMEIIGNR